LENKKIHAANETRFEQIKSLKGEKEILSGQVHRLEVVLESNDIQYRQEIDAERDQGIKHDLYVGDHIIVVNGLRASAHWYRPGRQEGRFIDSKEALHAEVTRVTRDCENLLNTYKVKLWRPHKHIKELRRAATGRFRNFRVSLRRFDIIFSTRQRCFTGTPRRKHVKV
jgi:hypothetical protein